MSVFSWSTLRAVFKYGVPMLIAISILMALADQVSRSQTATEALAKYANQLPILVGAGSENRNGAEIQSRYYQLIPNLSSPPRLIEISWAKDGKVAVQDDGANWFGFLFSTIMEIVVLIAVFRLWRRDMRAATVTSLERARGK